MTYESELRKFPLLQSIDDEELAHLAGLVAKKTFKKNSFIIHADDPGANLMFLAAGQVRITISHEAKEIVITQLEEGDFFGEISVLTGEDRSANVIAVADTTLFVLSKEDFERHIGQFGGLSLALLRELAGRLRMSSSKIADLALLDVANRLERTLRSLGKPQLIDGTEILVIESRPTHQELAAMVGTSREMVTRALKRLEADEDIVCEGKRIELHFV